MKKLLLTLFLCLCFINVWGISSSSAYMTNSLTNATGNGPIVNIPFNAITFDDTSSFNLSNGQYTAPGTGTLIVTGIIEISNVGPLHKTFAAIIKNVTTSEERYVYAINPYHLQDDVPPTGYSLLPFCETMKCSSGDIFVLQVFVIGGPITVTINGGSKETRLSFNYFN